ncbi:MAG: hypothetical protein H0X64_14140 [Gemmatimonadaceae bacterium]|nr:hypothetical protein [Gemmatimonadaceae bacterium]
MKLETFPLILGAIIAIIGLALIVDSRMADRGPLRERRRRTRLERNRGGELLIGLGVLAMGAAVIGRDSWRYSILSILIGAGLLLVGAFMNRSYLAELVTNRGASRRRPEALQDRPVPTGKAAAVFSDPTPPPEGETPLP